MHDTLLVPLDGSTFSEHALPMAAAIARRSGASLRLVLVHTPLVLPADDLAPLSATAPWMTAHRDREVEYLEERAEALRGTGLEVEAELRDGDVGQELTRLADDADLVVLATHGRGGLARAWLGSVADALVRQASAPILLIRPEDEREAEGEGEEEHMGDRAVGRAAPPEFTAPRTILAATDGSDAATAAAHEAAELARQFEAKLVLLRIVAFPGGLASPYIPHTAEMDRTAVEEGLETARNALDELAAGFDDLQVETMVTQAFQAARGILTAAEETGADMIALGTHRRTVLGRAVLGSTADKVIRASTLPVLVGHA